MIKALSSLLLGNKLDYNKLLLTLLYTHCIQWGEAIVSVVVSVRIPRHVKETLEKHGVNIAEFIRQKLVEEAERLEEDELWDMIDEIARKLRDKIDPYEWARIIDEDRKSR